MSLKSWMESYSIWAFAFGYFACYVPYSLITKMLTKGLVPGSEGQAISGFAVLPISAAAAAVGMVIFVSAMRWWKYANHVRVLGVNIPTPSRWTLLSGLCATCTVGTTTLAYTFEGVSIVFAMLLMRGGVLVIAPIVDAISGRKVRWFAWAGLGMSILALLVSLVDTKSYAMPFICVIDIIVYLASSDDADTNRRYFVEEQMVATPALAVILAIYALLGSGNLAEELSKGFTAYWGQSIAIAMVIVGFLSQGTGVFGNLIYLDRRENTYCVPVNRSSSILAGVVASYLLLIFPGQRAPGASELIGAALVIGAIVFLTIPPMMEKRRQRAQQAAST